MNECIEFQSFPKVPRLNRDMCITEKIDGTNAQVCVLETGEVLAGSRKRWITPKDDNFGFAKWVAQNADDLRQLGVGHHYGEWWGSGVQRGYGLNEKRFSLFNVDRWSDDRPECCSVVPVLYRGPFCTSAISEVVENLRTFGSQAAPEFMKPEGVMVWHSAARHLFKVTLEKDEAPKGLREVPS